MGCWVRTACSIASRKRLRHSARARTFALSGFVEINNCAVSLQFSAPRGVSIARDAAIHGAMNPAFKESDLGFAVERPERGFQELGAKTWLPDGADRRAFGFVPGDAEAIVRHRPRHLQQPARGRKRAVFAGIGGKLVKDQCKAHRQFGRKKQRVAVQGKSDMAIRSEFAAKEVLDI